MSAHRPLSPEAAALVQGLTRNQLRCLVGRLLENAPHLLYSAPTRKHLRRKALQADLFRRADLAWQRYQDAAASANAALAEHRADGRPRAFYRYAELALQSQREADLWQRLSRDAMDLFDADGEAPPQ